MGDFGILNLVTALMGIVVASILIYTSYKNKYSNWFLGWAFLLLAFRSLSIYLFREGLIINTFIMGTVSAPYYFIPPVFYLYIKKLAKDENVSIPSDKFHFIIPILTIVLLIYYLIAQYIHFGQLSLPVQVTKHNDHYPFFYIQIGYHAKFIVLYCIFYLILSWRIYLTSFKKTAGEHIQFSMTRNWLRILLGYCTVLTFILFMSAIVTWAFDVNIPKMNIANLNIVRSFVLIFLFTRVFVKRELLLGIPKIKTSLPVIDEMPSYTFNHSDHHAIPVHHVSNANEDTEAEIIVAERTKDIYFDSYGWVQHFNVEVDEKSLNLETDKIDSYIKDINKFMDKAPYTNPDFDMKSISTSLSIPYYHLEFLFRYYNQYTFAEYRNMVRVRHVLNDIDQGERANYTLEELGKKAGFSSRSSFFRVFKQVTGKTPKQYFEDSDIDYSNSESPKTNI